MNLIYSFVLATAILFIAAKANGQSTDDPLSLVKQGMALNKDKKYSEAIEKFNRALKSDSTYLFADFELGYTLNLMGKGMEAISYLQKATKSTTATGATAFDVLGDVYDKNHQTGKAIEAYVKGIAAFPADKVLKYNLGLIYWHNKQYAEAEGSAVDAIKLDPDYANAMRMYALVTFHQNKRADALLGLCSFILLEPNTARSAEAYGNIQHILQGGELKPEPGARASQAVEASTYALNQAITKAVNETAREQYALQGDQLTAQLKYIFTATGQLAEKESGNDFFRRYMAAYFYQLAQSPNMEAFARLASRSFPESAKWIKENTKQVQDLDNWVKDTKRSF